MTTAIPVTHPELEQLSQKIKIQSQPFRRLMAEVANTIVGQEVLVHRMLVGLLANGHLLIEGVPGLAKTTAVACLAKGIQTGFQRLQFTPDLLPADLIGTLIYRHADLSPAGPEDRRSEGTDLFQHHPGRRNQSRAG